MNPDFLIATFPIVVLGGVALLLYISHVRCLAECPHCFQRIPKIAFEEGLPCIECGEMLASDSGTVVEREFSDRCRRCESTAEVIELWDGGIYCKSCVESSAPELRESIGSVQFSESMPYSVRALTWRMLKYTCVWSIAFGALFGAFTAVFAPLQMALEASGWMLMFADMVGGMYVVATAAAMPVLRPRIMAWKGKLIFRFGTRLLVAPINDCRWSEGKLSEMTIWSLAFLLRGPAIIIEVPKDVTKDGNQIAAGFTKGTLKTWKSFLSLAGIPQRTPKRAWWRRLGD